jgi:hypothetical protein
MVNYITYTMALMCAFTICLVTAQQTQNDIFGNTAWPLAFKKTCGVAQDTDKYIRDIINEYDKQGFQCSKGTYDAFNSKDPCASVNIVEGILWPIEYQKLQDMFRKLYDGVNCVAELMTGQKFD